MLFARDWMEDSSRNVEVKQFILELTGATVLSPLAKPGSYFNSTYILLFNELIYILILIAEY